MIKEDFYCIAESRKDWEEFSNKTILITGANGFLPAYMVETLLLLNRFGYISKPCKVIALVRNEEHAKKVFSEYLKQPDFTLLVQNVTESINIDEPVDFICHAASPASPKYYNIDPVGVILPNVIGTINLLEFSVKHKVKSFLYFSSGEVYGELPDDVNMIESNYGYLDPMKVRSCYGESKRMGENICISYSQQYNIPVKIVRPSHTYGPGMKLDDGRVFADFVKNIVDCENIELKSDGSAIRSFCYLADATTAFFKVLLDGEDRNAYNVANPDQVVSIKDLANILINLFPEKKLTSTFIEAKVDYLKSPVKSPIPNISKIENLGWKPHTTIEVGFKKTIESYIK